MEPIAITVDGGLKMEEQQKSIRTEVVINLADLNPKIERLIKAYEELKAAASDLDVQLWQDCFTVQIKK